MPCLTYKLPDLSNATAVLQNLLTRSHDLKICNAGYINVNRPCDTELKKTRSELASAQLKMYIPERYFMPRE